MASAPPPGRTAARPLLAHAAATRSAHFRTLLRSRATPRLLAAAVTAAGISALIEQDVALLKFGLFAAPASVALILFAMADRQAAKDFFAAYAAARGFTHVEKGDLLPVTPLLAAGDRRFAEHLMKGRLRGSDRAATLALYTYETRQALSDGDGPGGRQEDYDEHHFTVVLVDVPQAFPQFSGVYLGPRRGPLAGDWLRGGGRREIELESVEFHEAYRLRTSEAQDPGPVRELFAPALQVRLLEHPLRPGLELGAGGLCVFVPGRLKDAAGLDRFLDAARELLGHVERELSESALIGA